MSLKNNPQDFMPKDDKLWGMYRGVIEDNKDPEKMGRCKIRVFGVHTEKSNKDNLEGITTDDLPWAEPALGLFEGSISGFGSWSVPLQGSHVFLFFENGHILKPIFFATIPGLPIDQYHGYAGAPGNEGFSDPDEEFPVKELDYPFKPTILGDPDWHKLGREDTGDTCIQYRDENLDEGVEQGDGNTWDEPASYYAAEYPYNKVFATSSGITIEIDDTDGEERIHIWHPSNSYIEINKDGNVIIRNDADKYEIVRENKYKHILKNENTTIDENRTKQIGKDEKNYISQNQISEVAMNKDETVGVNLTLHVKGNTNITSVGPCNVFSGSTIACDAPTVHLNSGNASSTPATTPK